MKVEYAMKRNAMLLSNLRAVWMGPAIWVALGCALWLAPTAGAFQDETGQPVVVEPAPGQRPIDANAKKRARLERLNGQANAGQANGEKGSAGQPGNAAQRRGMRDPAQMVSMMMEKFDADGDEKLNTEELTAMFTFMRERGQMGMMAGRMELGEGQSPRPGRNPNAKRPGGRVDDSKQNEAGGVTPKRPPAE